MRKSYFKLLAVFLAVLMLVSTMPMAALAVEADTHDHADCDCATGRAITCTHPVMNSTYGHIVKSANASGHELEDVINYSCTTCVYSYTVSTGKTYTVAHQYSLDNGSVSAACLVCSYPYPG